MTAGAENSVDLPEAMRRLITPFIAQGGDAYVGRCCAFLYAGALPANTCGTCKQPVLCTKVASVEEAVEWATPLP